MVSLEQELKQKESKNEAKSNYIKELRVKYEDMKMKVNKYKRLLIVTKCEYEEILKLSRLELQIQILGKKDFQSEAHRQKIERLEQLLLQKVQTDNIMKMALKKSNDLETLDKMSTDTINVLKQILA